MMFNLFRDNNFICLKHWKFTALTRSKISCFCWSWSLSVTANSIWSELILILERNSWSLHLNWRVLDFLFNFSGSVFFWWFFGMNPTKIWPLVYFCLPLFFIWLTVLFIVLLLIGVYKLVRGFREGLSIWRFCLIKNLERIQHSIGFFHDWFMSKFKTFLPFIDEPVPLISSGDLWSSTASNPLSPEVKVWAGDPYSKGLDFGLDYFYTSGRSSSPLLFFLLASWVLSFELLKTGAKPLEFDLTLSELFPELLREGTYLTSSTTFSLISVKF